MSEVRMQPKSAPRATGIARTTTSSQKPNGTGSSVSASPGASSASRAHVAAQQPAAKLAQRVGGVPLSRDAMMLIGTLVDKERERIDALGPDLTPVEVASLELCKDTLTALETAYYAGAHGGPGTTNGHGTGELVQPPVAHPPNNSGAPARARVQSPPAIVIQK